MWRFFVSIISCSRFKDLDLSPTKYSSSWPALIAIVANRHEILKILLDSSRATLTGAQIQDFLGKAIIANRPDSLKVLLDSGQLAAPEAQIEQFFNSVFTFEEFSPMARLLLKYSPLGVPMLSWRALEGGTLSFFQYLISCKQVDGNERNNRGETSPLITNRHGHEALVKLLLSRSNTDVNATDCLGMSALHWAVENGHVKIIDSLLACERLNAEINLVAQRSGSNCAASNLPSNETKSESDGENLGPITYRISNELCDATLLSSDIECQIDPESEEYTSVLKSAAHGGETRIIQLLL